MRIPVGAFRRGGCALLIGMVFTSIGCLLHGCGARRPSGCAIGFAAVSGAFWVSGRLPFDGGLFLCSFAAYGVGRWILDPNFPKPSPARISRIQPQTKQSTAGRHRNVWAGKQATIVTGQQFLFGGLIFAADRRHQGNGRPSAERR
jgi:hypothetical protein